MVDNSSDADMESRAVAAAIAIPAHVVTDKGHGHAGTAMALAPLAHVLFSRILRHNPQDPAWLGRDRFVLSAGHASLLLYTQLYLTGYGLTLEDLAASRRLDAITPGHPERHVTPGVEMSTGPLGQGLASAVGMAMAAKKEAAQFRLSGLVDPTIWVLAGDGCLQEGVSSESSSLAATLGLDNLVAIWDDNRVTIDATTDATFTEDVRARYSAYGWRVLDIDDATDLDGIESVLRDAASRDAADGRPTLIAVRSTIGAPSQVIGGQPAAHAGPLAADDLSAVKESLGFTGDAELADLVPDDVLAFTRTAQDRGAELQRDWEAAFGEWVAAADFEAAARWLEFHAPAELAEAFAQLDALERPEVGEPLATRTASGAVLRALADHIPLWGGSADLSGSTAVDVPGEAFTAENPTGEFIRFGVREHAMAAILSGIALFAPFRPFGSTYLAFSDYMRPSIRLAALMRLPVIYVFTHDSVAVGEDGPTHQPVEQIAGLRTVPGLHVVRPADADETIAVWKRILVRPEAPTALVLSRQAVPALEPREELDVKASHGGYVAWQHGEGDELALIATGSEVHVAIDAARALAADGVGVRVVSMPCVEWFEQSPPEWRDAVLPPAVTGRVAVEAGRGDAWWKWVGSFGAVVGIDEFGESGSGAEVMERRGMTVANVLDAARTVLDGTR